MKAQGPIGEIIGAAIVIVIFGYIFFVFATTSSPLQPYFKTIWNDILAGIFVGTVIGIIILILWVLSHR